MGVKRFEDLIGWQKSRTLFKKTHEITSRPPLLKDFPLRDQMRRSALSVMSNIAEGFDKGGDKEFVQLLFVAKGSCSELRSQLHAACDIGYLDKKDFQELWSLAEEISRILRGLIKAIKEREKRQATSSNERHTTLHFTLCTLHSSGSTRHRD
jgi:four helix bundle protein